jgi:hypothetical protein
MTLEGLLGKIFQVSPSLAERNFCAIGFLNASGAGAGVKKRKRSIGSANKEGSPIRWAWRTENQESMSTVLFRAILLTLSFVAINLPVLGDAIPAKLYSVEVSAVVQANPARVTLQWPADTNATAYTISRLGSSGSWTQVGSLSGTATQFADTNVALGSRIEYRLYKTTSRGYIGTGYLLAGINAPAVESRGKVILLVDATWSSSLAPELRRLEQDLLGDGWLVLRQDVPRSTPVPQVKAIIQNLYQSDPANVRALFLFGHIPVPYSGDFAPDGHANHTGAWPADVYYADIDGTWTDSAVTAVDAEKEWNHNTPGDGKFDQSTLPSDVELEVGRVDLYNMTCFANKTWSRNEEYLLRQYLEKDHRFRHGQLPLPRRGLVIDNFGADNEALASTAWRAFAPMFGAANNTQISWGTYFSTLASDGYLWSYGNGGGGYYTCAGIGSSDDFALNDAKVVFTFFFGSYYGDWDNESNFLRAPLGSTTYTLTSTWGSRPHWFVHPMALGETIGFTAKLTQNNSTKYEPANFGTREVHTALLGDPTLRMHPVIPPSNFSGSFSSGATLSWAASADQNIAGYYVYRATSDAGPFVRISSTPVAGTSFNDPAGTISSVYMVRALKLETSGSGTYYNLSQGVFTRLANVPAAPSNLSGSMQGTSVALTWQDNSADETGFRVYRKQPGGSYTLLVTTAPNTLNYVDTTPPAGTNIYALAAFNNAGESSWSSPVTVVPASSASATFVRSDSTTGGNWKGTYGTQGYNIIQNAQSYPANVNVAATGNANWTWNGNTSDPAAPLRATDNTRLAACWYSGSGFDLQLWFQDSIPHRVSFYFLDWDRLGRREVLEIFHSESGALLASRTVENFQTGLYLTYDLVGRVTVRLRPLTANAVVSAIFFDPAVATVSTPVFSPPGGTYTNSVSVTLSSSTSGATIRYTTNGVDPSPSSTLFTAPISVSATTTIKARAFKDGMADSAVATAQFNITTAGANTASAIFNGVNTTRGGTWKGAVGSEGHIVIGDSQMLPNYAALTASGKSDWTWEYSTSDTRALQRDSLTSRLAACWYANSTFDLDLNLTDSAPRRVSFYCLDWDRAGRQQRIEILDFNTRQVLHSYDLASFGSGVYLDYTLRGHCLIRFSRTASFNAVLSGIFFGLP